MKEREQQQNNQHEEEEKHQRQTVAPKKVCNACVWHKSKLDNFGKGKHETRAPKHK